MDSKEEILKKDIKNNKWFHSIKFNENLISPGRFSSDRPQNYTLYGILHYLENINLKDTNCVDMGTMDGLIAFSLKYYGAKKVVATDMAYRKNFYDGMKYLNLDIEYKQPYMSKDLPVVLNNKKVDLIVCAGILYHVLEPMKLLSDCRNSLKNNGLLLLETQYMYYTNKPYISFSPIDKRYGSIHANTFFRPTLSTLIGMLEISGFEVISTISINSRVTILAKAIKPSQINSSYKMVNKICKTYENYENYRDFIDYKQLNQINETSTIKYNIKPNTHYWINSSSFKSNNIFQPKFNTNRLNFLKKRTNDAIYKIKTMIARKKYIPTIS